MPFTIIHCAAVLVQPCLSASTTKIYQLRITRPRTMRRTVLCETTCRCAAASPAPDHAHQLALTTTPIEAQQQEAFAKVGVPREIHPSDIDINHATHNAGE